MACIMGFQVGTSDKEPVWVRSLGREDPLEEDVATHSSNLAWRIPWTEEPDRLQSMGSHRVGHNRSDLTCKACIIGQISTSHFILKILLKFFIKSLKLPFLELPSRCYYYKLLFPFMVWFCSSALFQGCEAFDRQKVNFRVSVYFPGEL